MVDIYAVDLGLHAVGLCTGWCTLPKKNMSSVTYQCNVVVVVRGANDVLVYPPQENISPVTYQCNVVVRVRGANDVLV